MEFLWQLLAMDAYASSVLQISLRQVPLTQGGIHNILKNMRECIGDAL